MDNAESPNELNLLWRPRSEAYGDNHLKSRGETRIYLQRKSSLSTFGSMSTYELDTIDRWTGKENAGYNLGYL